MSEYKAPLYHDSPMCPECKELGNYQGVGNDFTRDDKGNITNFHRNWGISFSVYWCRNCDIWWRVKSYSGWKV